MHFLSRSLVILFFGIFASNCQPLKPSQGVEPKAETATISFVVFNNSLNAESQPQLEFEVIVYQLESMDSPRDEATVELRQRFSDSQTLTLQGLTVGAKEFVVKAYANQLETVLYQGSLRYQVILGSQKINDPLLLRKINLDKKVSVSVALTLKIGSDVEGGVTYNGKDMIAEKLTEYNCAGCHMGENPSAGIGLDVFPFTIIEDKTERRFAASVAELLLDGGGASR